MENTNVEQTQKSGENKVKKILLTCLNVVFYAIIALLLIFSIMNLSKKDEESIPSIFGKGYMTVLTDSMTGDQKDSFTPNDLIFVSVITEKNREKKLAKVEAANSDGIGGSIITFKTVGPDGNFILDSHRVIEVVKDSKGNVIQYITRGDNALDVQTETVNPNDVRAVYTGKWTGAGSFFKFLQTKTGFFVVIVLPVLLFFIFELVMLIFRVNKYKKYNSDQKHQEELDLLKEQQEKALEAERARIRAEILAEQQKNANPVVEEESVEEELNEEESDEESETNEEEKQENE